MGMNDNLARLFKGGRRLMNLRNTRNLTYYENWEQAVVRVWHGLPDKSSKYRGTAFLIAPGYLVTVKHIIGLLPCNTLYLNGPAWYGSTHGIEEIFCHPSLDIAVLKLKEVTHTAPYIPLARPGQANIQPRQQVVLAGYSTQHADLATLLMG
jgi:hypothetical protein